jgi:hypothetical protein
MFKCGVALPAVLYLYKHFVLRAGGGLGTGLVHSKGRLNLRSREQQQQKKLGPGLDSSALGTSAQA